MKPDQATNELTEEQVLNFLVNTLGEEIDIGLGENADIDSGDIWDVLVGATEDSVSHLSQNRRAKGERTETDLGEWKGSD